MGLIVKTIKGNTKQNIVDIAPVTSTTASNPVPEGAKYAFVDKLGGMCRKCTNIMPANTTDYSVVNLHAGDYITMIKLNSMDSNGRIELYDADFNYIDYWGLSRYDEIRRVHLNYDAKYLKCTNQPTNFYVVNGSDILPYEPYTKNLVTANIDGVVVSDGSEATSYNIPTALKNVEGYGWGIDALKYNYIDFNTMKYHRKVGRYDMGVLKWEYLDSYKFFYVSSVDMPTDAKVNELLAAFYAYGGAYKLDSDMESVSDMTICRGNVSSNYQFKVKNLSYTDAEAFKTAMNGVYIYYELAEEVVTDISDLIPELTVEDMDLVSFHSENNVDVPNRIRYALPDGNMRQPIAGVEELHFVVKSTGTGETLMTYDLDLDRPMYGIDEACDYMDVDEGTYRQLTEYVGLYDVQYTAPVGPSRPQALFTLTEPAAVRTKVYTETGVYSPYMDIYTNKWLALNNVNNIAVVPYKGIDTVADLEKVIERIGVVDALYLRATEASPVDVDEDTLLFLDSLADMDGITLYITDQDGNPVQYTCVLDGLYGVPKLDIVFNGSL